MSHFIVFLFSYLFRRIFIYYLYIMSFFILFYFICICILLCFALCLLGLRPKPNFDPMPIFEPSLRPKIRPKEHRPSHEPTWPELAQQACSPLGSTHARPSGLFSFRAKPSQLPHTVPLSLPCTFCPSTYCTNSSSTPRQATSATRQPRDPADRPCTRARPNRIAPTCHA